ncbi:MAG: secondary thiamine-phosphate synthase enzyme YjbQ [Chloroflexota bacterium]
MVTSESFSLNSKGNTDIIDVTDKVSQVVGSSGLRRGVATVFVVGSTAGVTTMEFEPGLIADMRQLFERLAPANQQYQHNLRWGDLNGHSHLRASLLGPSLSIPFADGQLQLGTWQQIVLIDFDVRPRHRVVIVQVVGE